MEDRVDKRERAAAPHVLEVLVQLRVGRHGALHRVEEQLERDDGVEDEVLDRLALEGLQMGAIRGVNRYRAPHSRARNRAPH